MDRPLSTIIEGKWTRLVEPAHIVWHELTRNELLKCGGDLDKLTTLVHSRCDMTRDEARKQVVSFFERHRTT
ncbi:general stress protein CsbD [Pseudomonas sp. G34]|uniref:general stress protein CsbD n=1 Tax=Pseudomonas sp. G34 TaxID=3059083 RepID=UPI0028076199|nr:general stress protein CsbD [Pseudomonas sp. G34]MDQ7983729.1 general stress protein CsbD [Pseudomonas sp. G34]